jgi:hypothetical protein
MSGFLTLGSLMFLMAAIVRRTGRFARNRGGQLTPRPTLRLESVAQRNGLRLRLTRIKSKWICQGL